MKPPSFTRFATFLLAGLVAACGKSPSQDAPPAPPPPEVGVLAVQPESVPLQRSLVGRLSAFRSADVRARVPGVLQKRVYEEGSDVAEGDILFEIDPAPLKAALDAANASQAQAQATFANSRVAAERARELAPKGFVSRADRDNAEAAERSASAALAQAKANVQAARINLGYATVRAPISGRAGKQAVTEGALVGQGEATLLTTIDQVDPLYVNFTLGVAELAKMRRAREAGHATLAGAGQAEVVVELPDGSAYAHKGVLNFSDTAVDPATGAVRLRAQIPNPDRVLLPGMYVTIEAELGQQNGVFRVPQAAVLRDAEGPYVYVVGADGTVARKGIQADESRDGYWLVSDGLAAGDQVVVSGVQRVQAGKPAKAVPWQPDAPAPPAPSPAGAR